MNFFIKKFITKLSEINTAGNIRTCNPIYIITHK